MKPEVSTQDIVFGAVVLVIVLFCAYWVGGLLSRWKNARFARAWAPLVPVINGTITNDGAGAATSWLTGMYAGRQVRASLTPDRNRYSGETGPRYNYFDVALLDVQGKQDWSIRFQNNEGHPAAADDALEERLRQAGIVAMLTSIGSPEARYNAGERSLQISLEVTSGWAPMPESFQVYLNHMLQLAEINATVNPA
jgi:hypothetical protein